jgi:hypothetical protein
MSVQGVFPIVLIAASAAFAILILRRNRRDPASRTFLLVLALFAAFAAVYLPGRTGFHSEPVRAFYAYGNALVFPFLTAALFHFTLLFPRRSRLLDRPGLPLLLYLPAALLASALLADIRLFAARVEVLPGYDQFYTVYGPLGPLFVAVVMGPALLAVASLAAARLRPATPVEARVLDLLLGGVGTLVAFSTATAVARTFFGIYVPVGESEVAMVPLSALAYAVLRHGLLITPVLEEPSGRERRFLATPGVCYILSEANPAEALEVLGDLASHGTPAAVFTRSTPDALRARSGLRRTPLYWLGPWSAEGPPPGYAGSVDHTRDLANASCDFFAAASRGGARRDRGASPGGVLLVEDLTLLTLRHGFTSVVKMVASLRKAALRHGGVFLLQLNTRSLGAGQVDLLYRTLGLAPGPAGKVE